jgi:L-lactate dehydrogenase
MKIGIVGTGMVGSSAAYALIMRGIGSELVLVDKNSRRAQAEADDLLHAVPFAHPIRVRAGDYPDLNGAGVIIISAGVGQKPGESRLELLQRNASIFKQIIPAIIDAAPNAILVVATNPVDVMTHLTAHIASLCNVPSNHVLGSGTTLDTARYRALLGDYLGVDPNHIHGYVVGEHGDSEVLVWSRTTIGVVSLDEFCQHKGVSLDKNIRGEIDHRVRRAAYEIIEGKGATYYGIGSALARITHAITDNQRAILTVCAPRPDIVGVKDVTVAMPHLVGGEGIMGYLPIHPNEAETEALKKSATLMKQVIDDLDIASMTLD